MFVRGEFPLFDNEKSSKHQFLNTPFLLKDDFDMDAYKGCTYKGKN